jgi:hypothetical protein
VKFSIFLGDREKSLSAAYGKDGDKNIVRVEIRNRLNLGTEATIQLLLHYFRVSFLEISK